MKLKLETSLFFFFSLFLILLPSIVLSDDGAPPASSWWGFVSIDANTSTETNGSVIEAYIRGSVVANVTVGQWISGYYLIDVPCNQGDNVTIRVYNLTANETAQTCVAGQSTYLNLSANKTANGVVCTYEGGCTSGYCVDGYCCDSACTGANRGCNVAGRLGTCTSTATTTTTTTTAPAGGYVPSPTTTAAPTTTTTTIPPATTTTTLPPVEEVQTVETIEVGETGTFSYEEPTIELTNIQVKVKNTVNSVQITVTQSSTKPAAIAVTAPGAVYGYYNIEKTNIDDEDVESATIMFKVKKDWITGQNIDETTIALERFKGGAWNKLPTTKVDEDGTYFYFQATTTELSIFAVTAEKVVTTTTTTTTLVPVTTTTLPVVPLGGPIVWIIVAAIAAIVVTLLLRMYSKRRKRRSRWKREH